MTSSVVCPIERGISLPSRGSVPSRRLTSRMVKPRQGGSPSATATAEISTSLLLPYSPRIAVATGERRRAGAGNRLADGC